MRVSGGRIRDGRFERIEPRCHICRDEKVRVRVNELLDWHGVRVPTARGWRNAVSFAGILCEVNGERKEPNLISYASLRVHAKRHYDFAWVEAYCIAQMEQNLNSFLSRLQFRKPIEKL